MSIETAETIDIFVDSVRSYSLTRDQDGSILLKEENHPIPGTIAFTDRDVLETFVHALNKLQRY